MAESEQFTKSFMKGQIALTCQLCENEPKIKWKCVECDLMMCQRCRDKVHPKFRSADDHTIVDLKSISEHAVNPAKAKFDFTRLKCKEHNGQACLFCKDCDNVVCPSCVTSTHKKHDLIEIQDEVQHKIDLINKQKVYYDSTLKGLDNSQAELRNIETTEQTKFNKVKSNINANEKTLVDALRKHTEKLSKQLNEEWNSLSREISTEKTKVTNLQTKVQKEKKDLEEILESKNVVKIIDATTANLKYIDSSTAPTFKSVSTFVPANTTDESQLFGSLQPRLAITDAQLIEKFETEHDVNKLLVHPDDSIWISHRIASILLNLKRSTQRPIRTFKNQYVFDMAFTKRGDLLLSIENYKISAIPHGKEHLVDCFKAAPLVTSAVHVSSKDQIIFGEMDDGPHFPVGGTRQVRVINVKGQTLNVFQMDRENKPLFTFPYRITSNRGNNIAVVDIINNDYNGRVVVLSEEGKVQNIYNGSHLGNKDTVSFKPIDITTVQLDNFLVLDYKSLCLHMLDGNGNLISYCWINLSIDALPQSFCVGIDPGQLYIGYSGYDKDKTSRPQVCCVKVPWK